MEEFAQMSTEDLERMKKELEEEVSEMKKANATQAAKKEETEQQKLRIE